MAITETIPSLGTVPTTDDPANFDANADLLLGTSLPNMVTAMNTYAGQANTLADDANQNAVTAVDAADAAAAAANYKGLWEDLTGALAIPASVFNDDALWALKVNIANVASSEPSATNADWFQIPALPTQAGFPGGVLTTDGAALSWVVPDSTLGALTKTFLTGELATIALSEERLVPVISVAKEVPQTGSSSNTWAVTSTLDNYTREDSAYAATTLDFVGSDILELGTGSFASADVGKTIEANDGAFVLTATDGSYVETTAPSSYDQVASGFWGMYGVVYNAADGDLELSGYIEGYDIAGASYDSVSYNASSELAGMGNIAFNNDGTKLYIVDWSAQDINEFSLSTGFDVSTASFSKRQSTSSWETDPKTIAFNSDGTKMFLAGGVGDDVNEYTLSTAFDISTLVYVAAFSFASQENNVASITFNNDGTKLYVIGSSNDTVYQYTLSTAFTISTASYDSVSLSVGVYDGNPQQIAFNNDGTKFYFVGLAADKIHQYSLSAAFDLSTASYDSVVFSVASQTTAPRGLWFNSAGNKMFIGGDNIVYQYSTGSLRSATGYQPVHTTASIDSTYWTDINSMTADQNAGSGTVYYAISTDDRTTWTVIKDVGGERDIVRNNAGTWQYNSNGTYASETWVNGATNTELAALAEAMDTAQNRMDKTQLDAVTDPNHIALGDDLDLAIIFKLTSGATVPSSNGVAINYDANVLNQIAVIGTDYDADFPEASTVRITALASNNLKVRVV